MTDLAARLRGAADLYRVTLGVLFNETIGELERLQARLAAADAALQFANQNMRPGLSGPIGSRWDELLRSARNDWLNISG